MVTFISINTRTLTVWKKLKLRKTDKSQVLNEDEQALFRKVCGQLNWISTQSRPNIAFDVCQLSTRLNTATVQDILQANVCGNKTAMEVSSVL